MASKYLDEFLAKASPETKAALEQTREGLARNGVENTKETPVTAEKVPVAERTDVKQIGQELKDQGAELKSDSYGQQTPPRVGEPRPYADAPAFMNEQPQRSAEKTVAQQTREGLQRDGQQNQPQPTKENAMDRAMATKTTPTTQPVQKSQELER
ncbi:hypothetical protein BN8_p06884 (plasmid) [Fibrisoma limi BUZ 3]|uniref:Uncharacterized protein n=1 Tax=Fibrisoma limi BUZ 3 TaxID=1185876 RepID=I2GU74_9BACT|nr:hypothetical protein [Fibrisoma limi]CCH57675.1 hypothetical protein BN8_p06884 [Fibrisoma limi BUZ 3]